MATKPVTTPEIWASNALYTTGPFIGSASKVVPPGATAAEGHRPGNLFPTPAEYENSQQNEITTWIVDWLFLGSSAGAADAHIVETDATGRTQVNSLTVSNIDGTQIAEVVASTATTLAALTISSAATAGINATSVTCTSGGNGVSVNIGNSVGTAFKTGTGSGGGATGYEVAMVGTPNTGDGFRCTADAATAAPSLRIEHAGTGSAMLVTQTGSGKGLQLNNSGGSGTALEIFGNSSIIASTIVAGAGQVALQATSGSNGATAVAAIGSGTAIGLEATGGNGSSAATAVRGTATHNDAVGVYGRTSTSGTTAAAGVIGEGRGTNESIGVKAISASGYALWIEADNVAPVSPAVYLKPQNGPPSNASSIGDLYCESGMRQVKHGTGNGYHSFYQGGDSESSASMVQFSSEGPFTSNSTVLWTTTISPYLADSLGNGYYGVSTGAELTITIVLNPRTQTAANATLSLQVIDNSDGGTVIFTRDGTGTAVNDGYRLLSSTTNWLGSITIMFQYAPPNEGDLNLQIDIRVGDGGGANIEARDVGCQIWGTFVP